MPSRKRTPRTVPAESSRLLQTPHYRFREHLPILALVLLLSTTIALYSPLSVPAELRGGSDFAINSAIQKSYIDTGLYSKDVELQAMRPGYLPLFSRAMAAFIGIFPGDTTAYLALSILLWALFLCGMYAFSWTITGQKLTAAVTAIACGFGYRAFNGVLWGVQLGQVLPRDFFVTLAPWALLLFIRYPRRPARLVTFAVLGLLANIHFLEAYYLIGFLLIMQLLLDKPWSTKGSSGWISLLLGAIAAFVLSIPTLLSNMTAARPLIVEQILRYRMPYLFSLNITEAAWWFLVPAALAIAGWPMLAKPAKRFCGAILVSAAVLSIGGHMLSQLFPTLRYLQFSRASRLLYVALLPLAAARVSLLLSAPNWSKRIVAIGLVGLLLIPLPLILGQFLALPTFSSSTDAAHERALDRAAASDPQQHAREFLAVSAWAKSQTPNDALFLVPPVSFSLWFRTVAERSVVTDQKDGANMIITQSDGGQAWYDRYAAVRAVYLQNSSAAFTDAAEKYDADYIIVDRTKHSLEGSPAFQNEFFAVYAVSE